MFSMERIREFASMVSAALAIQPSSAPDTIQICDQALNLMVSDPLCAQTVVAVKRASIELEGMKKSLNLLKFQQSTYRGRFLLTSTSVLTWICQTVDAGLQVHPDQGGAWPANLITFIRASMKGEKAGTKIVITLPNFIPEAHGNLTEFSYTIPLPTLDKAELEDRIREHAVQALKKWLGYEPTNEARVVAASLLMSMRQSPVHDMVYMMDGAWSIYDVPFSSVIHGGTWYTRQTAWTEQTLQTFHLAFGSSPLCDSNSTQCQALARVRQVLNGTNQSV